MDPSSNYKSGNEDSSLMADDELKRVLEEKQRIKLAQLNSVDLEVLTEHPDQEDMMS